LTEGLRPVGSSGQVARQVAYSSNLGRLLGLGGERRGERAREPTSQVRLSTYSITSSARASTAGGIVRPRAPYAPSDREHVTDGC
jgi:hypothetical protein